MKISELPDATNSNGASIPIIDMSSGTNLKLSFTKLLEDLKKELGVVDNPMRLCGHCGQWGALYCACRYCGAPIK